MRIGIEIVPDLTFWQSTILGIQAERAGFDTLWITDHFPNRDPYALLSMLSNYTDRIKLGPSVQSPLTRHPASIASAMATIDELSNGRAILGLGSGDKVTLGYLNYKWSGILTTIEHSINVIRELWNGEKITLQNKHFSLNSASIRVLPRHPIPIYLAAGGPKMVKLAGRLADGVLFTGASVNEFKYMQKHLDEGSKKRIHKSKPEKIGFTLVSVSNDYEAALNRTRRVVAVVISGTSEVSLRSLDVSVEEVSLIRKELAQGKFLEAEQLVSEKMIQRVTIAGTPADIIKRINQFKSIKLDELVIGSPLGPNKPKAIRMFQKEIIPAII